MADQIDDEKGLRGALTRDEIAESMARLAGALDDDADQLELLAGSPDLDAGDVLAKAAEPSSAARRARGRPAGAANRRNAAVFDYLEALGHRDPAVTLSMLQSADTMALAAALGAPKIVDGRYVRDPEGNIVSVPADPLKVLALQQKAAADLMPFKYAKKPLDVNVSRANLHLFLAGDLGAAMPGAAEGLSIFGHGEKANEINGETVRQTEGESHETVKPLMSQVKPGAGD